MDYLEFNNHFMERVKEKLAKDYGIEFAENCTSYTIHSSESDVYILFQGLSTHLFDEEKGYFETYQMMPRIGEMATYCSLKKKDDTLIVMHQRVLKNNQNRFVVFSNASQISAFDDKESFGNIISLPYSIIKPTYEETIAALWKKCHFCLDEDITCIINGDVGPYNLFDVMLSEKEKALMALQENTRR